MPLLLGVFAGVQRHERPTPESKIGLAEGLRRLAQLYDGWGKKDQATEWRQKLDEQKP